MTCQLLPWVLVSLLGAISGNSGDGADDPYLARRGHRREAPVLGQGAERREHRPS